MIALQGNTLSRFPLQRPAQESEFWIQNLQNATEKYKLKLNICTSNKGRLPDLSIKSTPKVVIGI